MKKLHNLLLSLLLFAGCNPLPTTSTRTIPTQTKIPSSTSTSESKFQQGLSTLSLITVDNITQVKKIDALLGHTGSAGLVFSPDGNILSSYGDDGIIRIWELPSGQEIARFHHPPTVMALAFYPDGTKLASGGVDKTVRIWDMNTGQELAVFEGHTAGIGGKSLAWSPDGALIAAGSRNSVIRIWDFVTEEEIAVLGDHYDDITGLDFSPDGTMLASGGEDDILIVWDVSDFSKIIVNQDHLGDIGDVAFSPDGTMLASISGDITEKDNGIRLRDLETGEQITWMEGHNNSWYPELNYSPDGTMLVSAGGYFNDGTFRVYDTNSGDILAIITGSADGIRSSMFSPDGTLIATSSSNGVIELWGVY